MKGICGPLSYSNCHFEQLWSTDRYLPGCTTHAQLDIRQESSHTEKVPWWISRTIKDTLKRQETTHPSLWSHCYSHWLQASWQVGSKQHGCSSLSSFFLWQTLVAKNLFPMGPPRRGWCSVYEGCFEMKAALLLFEFFFFQGQTSLLSPGWSSLERLWNCLVPCWSLCFYFRGHGQMDRRKCFIWLPSKPPQI